MKLNVIKAPDYGESVGSITGIEFSQDFKKTTPRSTFDLDALAIHNVLLTALPHGTYAELARLINMAAWEPNQYLRRK